MYHDKPLCPSLHLALASTTPKPMDVVGFFGAVPVNRVTVDAADAMIFGTAAHFANYRANLSELLIATNGISVGIFDGDRKVPAERARLEGTPYEIAIEIPLTTCDLSAMFFERGDVYGHFRDLVVATFGLAGMSEDDFEELDLMPLFELRTQFAHAFGTAVSRWFGERGEKEA